jgi:hypothetical protein
MDGNKGKDTEGLKERNLMDFMLGSLYFLGEVG